MPKKFDFISPGVQLNEVDQSQLPTPVSDAGPVLIGRARSGPGMKPIRVSSYDDFLAIFGKPVSGEGASDADVWREGNVVGPTYASYAAQAHLTSETTPLTFVRLLGEKNTNAASHSQYAGWDLGSAGAANATIGSNVTAYGLFVWPVPNNASMDVTTGSLAAIIYANGAAVTLSGAVAGTVGAGEYANTSSAGIMIDSISSGTANEFVIEVHTSWQAAGGTNTAAVRKTINFSDSHPNYIRDQLNTNPQKMLASTNFGTTDQKYFLGETFEQTIRDQASGSTAGRQYGMILPLQSGSFNLADHKRDMCPAKTGWFINRKPAEQELFRLVSLHDGEWFQNNYEIAVEDLALGSRRSRSTFSLCLYNKAGSTIEKFSNLNLDPASDNYVAKRIGNQRFSWNSADLKYDIRGQYVNISDYFYVEVADAVANNTLDDTLALPMGFLGPLRPKRFALEYGSAQVQAGSASDGNSGVQAALSLTMDTRPDNGDTWTLAMDGRTYTLNFDTSVAIGDTSTTFTKAGAATIGIKSSPSINPLNAKILALLNTITGYSAPLTGDATLVITADVPGTNFTIVFGGTGASHATVDGNTAGTDTDSEVNASVLGNDDYPLFAAGADNQRFAHLPHRLSAAVVFPQLRLTTQGTNRGGDYKAKDTFGIRHVLGSGKDRDASYVDLIRALPGNTSVAITHHQTSVPSSHERSFRFHLEDICVKSSLHATPATAIESASGADYFLTSGSYDAENTYNVSFTGDGTTTGVKYLCGTKKVRKYKAAFVGGFDGLDIRQTMPFSNANLSDKTVVSSAPYNSVVKALDIIADAETVEMDMISIPGMTNSDLTDKILDVAEERADALAIIDLAEGYKPKWENSGVASYGSLNTTISALETRQINSSFGACYYPWVVVRDSEADVLAMPPSVAAIGALAFSAADAGAVWFAPAGFNRGGIKNLGGSPSRTSGLVVTHTIEHLTKDNRDDLYAANINPIARFPATNQIVIFGQKTLQQTASALDRINVRRLLLFLKRRIGKIADTILFEPNVNTTWNNFKASADAVLSQVQSGLGITEYKLVLDETTTTADLIDRNVMYAKIFIKPARAIEYIVVDFVVTRSGVEF
jgi:hypothetical protein